MTQMKKYSLYLVAALISVFVIGLCGYDIHRSIQANKIENIEAILQHEGFTHIHVDGYIDSPSIWLTCNKTFAVKRTFTARDKNGFNVKGKLCSNSIIWKNEIEVKRID